ncbi:antitoxin MazE7 [Streptomyces venezuelae]|uniref:Antitoxin MazE7 n=1 Tax=Streptomyces venezuelae TaxID=54571 RepID=A0A5P2D0B7_STRVZ|nr:antitoxin MazE7 [Streptomyces venezuelae]QES46539.1 antitoxin MazE7 [Streptomyces venezuelae]
MQDTTTLEVDTDVHERLTALAAARGLTLPAYLAELTAAQENEAGLARAARAFDEAVRRSGFREGFERDFGPASGRAGSGSGSRAA